MAILAFPRDPAVIDSTLRRIREKGLDLSRRPGDAAVRPVRGPASSPGDERESPRGGS